MKIISDNRTAALDDAAGSLNTEAPDFEKMVRGLFPVLNEFR